MARDFPGGPVGRICLPMQGTQVQSLVGELRSHLQLSPSATMKKPVHPDEEPTCHRKDPAQPKKTKKLKVGKWLVGNRKLSVLCYIFIGLETPSSPDWLPCWDWGRVWGGLTWGLGEGIIPVTGAVRKIGTEMRAGLGEVRSSITFPPEDHSVVCHLATAM